MNEDEVVEAGSTVEASITLPDFQNWGTKDVYDYSSQVSDYEDLHQLGEAINAARIALFKITDKINKYDRKAVKAKLAYERSYRREYLSSSERTEAMKRMRAELACEKMENDYIAAEQLKSELQRVSNSIRLELQTMQTIANNLRQQMKMV